MHALLNVNTVIRRLIVPAIKKKNTMYKKRLQKKGQDIIKHGIPTDNDPKISPF